MSRVSAIIRFLLLIIIFTVCTAVETKLFHGFSGMSCSDVNMTKAITSCTACAQLCLTSPPCHGFMCDGNTCHVTGPNAWQTRLGSAGSILYIPISELATLIQETTTVAVTEESTTVASTVTTTAPSAPCTNPVMTITIANCPMSKHLHVVASLRMFSSRALLFLSDGGYLLCDSMDAINNQHGVPCASGTLAGSALDSYGVFGTGNIVAAAFSYPSTLITSVKYFIIKDGMVYCYVHKNASPYMKTCSGWVPMSVAARFGAGIPSEPDAVVEQVQLSDWDFWFLKNNVVYKSSGDETTGSLVATFAMQTAGGFNMFSVFPCNVDAVLSGANPGEYYVFEGPHHYEVMFGFLRHKGFMCRS